MYFIELRELYDLADKKPPTEIKLTLTGYRANEVLPEESGEHLVFKVFSSGSGMFTDMHYSARHKKWNAWDHQDADWVDTNRITGITHWFRLPEAPEQKGDGNRD